MSDDATTTGVAPIGKVGRGPVTLDPVGVRVELEHAFETARLVRAVLREGEPVDGRVDHVGDALVRIGDRIIPIESVVGVDPISDPRTLQDRIVELLDAEGGSMTITKDEARDWAVYIDQSREDPRYGYGATLSEALGRALR
jgi:hypothetical protein